MSEVNYNETIVIPFLQKKFQELVNNNLVLEVNLMVEQNKNKDLTEKFNNTTQNFALEISKRDSKIEELTNIANDRANIISINRSSIKEQQAIIDELNKQLNTARAEIEVLKAPPSKKKKTQPKDDILDGDVF
jgi:hypothetical protein